MLFFGRDATFPTPSSEGPGRNTANRLSVMMRKRERRPAAKLETCCETVHYRYCSFPPLCTNYLLICDASGTYAKSKNRKKIFKKTKIASGRIPTNVKKKPSLIPSFFSVDARTDADDN